MGLAAGTHRLGPPGAALRVRTYREGMASRVGHDLVLDVTEWEGTVDVADGIATAIALRADPRSLEVREGLGGVVALSDRDRAEIARTIDAKVLRGEPIVFRSSGAARADGDGLAVTGALTLAGRTQEVTARLALAPDGRLTGRIPLVQSRWGIKPYRGMMGALRVRDEIEVEVDARLPAT